MLSLSTHNIRELFFPAGMQPTPLHIDLALPDAVAGAAKVYFARSLGAKFKATPPAGAEGEAVWYIDEKRLTVLVGRLDQHLAKMTYSAAEGVLDDLQEQVEDQEVRKPLLEAFVEAVEFVNGLTHEERRDLRAYANACM
jgi:hypothetical protein